VINIRAFFWGLTSITISGLQSLISPRFAKAKEDFRTPNALRSESVCTQSVWSSLIARFKSSKKLTFSFFIA
jgi:hypothetical protein